MKSYRIFFILLCIVWTFSSCVTTRDTNFMQDISKDYAQVKPEEYRVIVGDQLEVTIYSFDNELSESLGSFADGGTLNIRADGTIKIPYLGRIQVEGMSLYEIGKLLSAKFNALSDGTTATVILKNSYFTFLGEMGTLRIAMDKPIMTIYEAIALAGGGGGSGSNPIYGDKSKVNIIRQTKDGTIDKTFDLRSKDVIDSEFYFIQPNDVIYVAKSKREFFGASPTIGGTLGVVTGFIGVVLLLVRLF